MFRNAVEGGMAGVFGSVFFRLFDFSQLAQTSLTSLTFVVPKTCGCRRMSFSTSRRQTFSKSNARAPSPTGSGTQPASANHRVPRPFRGRPSARWRQLIHRPPRWRGGGACDDLLAGPRTARRRAQPGHDFEEVVDGGRFFIGKHRTFNIQHRTPN